jgi:hypothetical protein
MCLASYPSSHQKVSIHHFLCRSISSGDFFEKHSTNADTNICTSAHPYEHTHVHPTPMSTFERLSQLDLEIHEVSHQEKLVVDGYVAS